MPLVLHGCSVQVLCDGREMEQFDVRQENDDTISCWIASQEGQVRAYLSVHFGNLSLSAIVRHSL